jgi:hypothetical protein
MVVMLVMGVTSSMCRACRTSDALKGTYMAVPEMADRFRTWSKEQGFATAVEREAQPSDKVRADRVSLT